MKRGYVFGLLCLIILLVGVLPAGHVASAASIVMNFEFGPEINPLGQRLEYILIPGGLSTPDGGTCGPAIQGVNPFHNWDGETFYACGPGPLTVTLNSVSLSPYTGQNCGGVGQLQGLLYRGPLEEIDPQDGCKNLLQDFMVQNSGATGALNAGQSFTFVISEAGTYTFASMNWCDVAGDSDNTGNATFTLEGPTITIGPCAPTIPTLSEWGIMLFSLLVVGVAVAVLRRRPMSAA